MCGIIGRIDLDKKIDKDCFMRMRDTMIHRGPDGCGLYVSDNESLALGHRRLSLIDLSESGSQPMHNEDKTIWLTCNGEIYNYKELREKLIQKGHIFYSTSDSETIIHGYEEWGTGILTKLKGMFAFGLYDQKKEQLFIARDRFGIKPLCFYTGEKSFIFSSEIKGIIEDRNIPREIDFSSFSDFFVYRYVPSPKTIWKNIFKLPPANYMIIDRKLQRSQHKYWELKPANRTITEKEAIEKVDELIYNSVKQHIISDVQVGSFLSGGYDSSAMVYYMSRMNYPTKTFSIGFEGWQYSEHQYAEIVADIFKTTHRSEILGSESRDLVSKLAFFYDEPFADISIVPTYMVSKMAAASVKAVLSGEGADELFAGYTWHKSWFENYFFKPKNERIKSLFNRDYIPFGVSEYSNAMAMGKFDQESLSGFLNEDIIQFIPKKTDWFYSKFFKPGIGTVKSFQFLDINTFMSEMVLTKVDRASMANSLEARVPFLDHELVEYIMGLDEKVYFKKDYKKFLLFENLRKVLPKTILTRSKQGFVGPDSYYMQMKWYKEILEDSSLIKEGLLNRDAIDDLILQEDHWRLWKVVIMEFWYRTWKH